jgi:hypothetical protein
VQNLQRDLAAMVMHGISDLAVSPCVATSGEFGAEGFKPTSFVGGVAASDDQTDAAGGTLSKVCGELCGVPCSILKAGVHGAHHHSVSQCGRANDDRGKEVRVGHGISLSGGLVATRIMCGDVVECGH